jgi:hypothetical protein
MSAARRSAHPIPPILDATKPAPYEDIAHTPRAAAFTHLQKSICRKLEHVVESCRKWEGGEPGDCAPPKRGA